MTKNATTQILDWLLQNQACINTRRTIGFTDWKRFHNNTGKSWPVPADKAVIGGFLAERMAFAFAAGFCAAVLKLVPSLPPDVITSLCISEEGGAHPRGIQTSLTPANEIVGDEVLWRLTGTKKYITCAKEADLFLVAASTGVGPDGKNKLRMVLLNAGSPGIAIKPMEEVGLVPEISHCLLAFENVRIKSSDFLEGDGYVDYIKPFRTIEDLHMCLSVMAYLFRIACLYNWPKEVKAQFLGLLSSFRTLAVADPKSAAIHIAFGGVFDQALKLIQYSEPYWTSVDPEVKNEWVRDKVLLSMAGNARKKRVETAWRRYGESPTYNAA